jgi:two-component system, chemotaxis family, chemotaxis protein CheY
MGEAPDFGDTGHISGTACAMPSRLSVNVSVPEAVFRSADYVKHTPTPDAGNAQHWGAGASCPATAAYVTENAKMARLILTVDDSPSIRLMMQLTLTAEGYEVKQTTDGVEALEFARHHSADLVLTDINMPRMDGLTLIRELRLLPAYKCVPMLVLTTESGQDRKLLGKEAGATGWLVKPFNTQQLIATIGRVL